MKTIKYLVLLVVMAASFSACVVSEGYWVPAHWAYGSYGRAWVPGHYAR